MTMASDALMGSTRALFGGRYLPGLVHRVSALSTQLLGGPEAAADVLD